MDKKYFISIKIKSDEAVIKETLKRIGIPNKKDKILYQTCHLIENEDHKCVIHFKEYFAINNGNKLEMINMNEDDFKRRNTILYLLNNWKLITFTNKEDEEYINKHKTLQRMFVLNYQEKHNWQLRTKVNLIDKKEQPQVKEKDNVEV